MLLLVPVTEFRLTLFYPALMVLMGAHYFPFTFLYGTRIFMLLGAALAGCGVVLAFYAPDPSAWAGGSAVASCSCLRGFCEWQSVLKFAREKWRARGTRTPDLLVRSRTGSKFKCLFWCRLRAKRPSSDPLIDT